MSTCTFSNLNGINKNCEAFLSAVKGFARTDPDFYFASKTAATNLATWKAGIDTNDDIWIPRPVRSIEVTDPEPVSEQDQFGVNYVTGFNAPQMNIYMSSNPCDYAEMVKAGSKMVRLFLFGEDGSKMGWADSTGKVWGFEAQMIARPLSAKTRENKLMQYMVIVNFTNIDEFNQFFTWNDGIRYSQYQEYVPEGYAVEITSALSSHSISVKLTKRCTTTVATGTWTSEILESNCSAPSVSVGTLSSGVSVLTVYATGTTDLAAGEYIKARLVQKTGSVYDAVTDEFIITL